MEPVSALEVYHDYLEAIDEEACSTAPDEYLDLLDQAETTDLLCARDEIVEMALDQEQRTELARLDALLLKHCQLVTAHAPACPDKPHAHWWWHLGRGPQVRASALAAAEEG